MKNLKSGLKGLFALLAIILAVWVNGVDSLFEEQTTDSSISITASSSQSTEEDANATGSQESAETAISSGVSEGQSYSTKNEVAAYIHQFNALPPNYLTKDEAEALGWDNAEGNLWEVTDGMLIGGDFFGNREGLLPKKSGRTYYEADINYDGGYRGAERIVYSNDGLIFYTDDHYESFEQLYGEGESLKMETIRLNGKKMTDRKAAHAYLKKKLHLPEYYGNNLDALWDCLTTDYSGKMIILHDPQMVHNQLGDYGDSLVSLLKEVAATNSAIRLILAYPLRS